MAKISSNSPERYPVIDCTISTVNPKRKTNNPIYNRRVFVLITFCEQKNKVPYAKACETLSFIKLEIVFDTGDKNKIRDITKKTKTYFIQMNTFIHFYSLLQIYEKINIFIKKPNSNKNTGKNNTMKYNPKDSLSL